MVSVDSVDDDCANFFLAAVTFNCFKIVAVWLVVISWTTFACKKQNKANNASKPVVLPRTPVALPVPENQKPVVKKADDEKPKEKPAEKPVEKPQVKAQTEGMTLVGDPDLVSRDNYDCKTNAPAGPQKSTTTVDLKTAIAQSVV
ncbi:hypothetical protein M3Y96_00411600 [Aphelenchoides besseyi]|nr:hypothetical protein M3Y96_00411600 [Aphelenchoides besseyi]